MPKRKRSRRPGYLLRSLLRHGRMFLVILLAYLIHVCIMPDVKIFGVTPSLIFAVTAVITVAFDRWRAAWTGMIFGILLEVMQPTAPLLNLLLYPISAVFGALVFSDKSPQQLEYERGIGKPGRNASPWLRTPLCAVMVTFIYEVINNAYVYLRSGVLPARFLTHTLTDLLLTGLLAALIMVPLRRFFGVRPAPDPGANLRPVPYRRR